MKVKVRRKKAVSTSRGRVGGSHPATKKRATTAPPKKRAATTPTKKAATTKGKGNRGGFHREMNPDTGFVVGTDQDTIAKALLAGGESRSAIVDSLRKEIEGTTRNGTEKAVTNVVSGVLNKMLSRGFTVDQHFQVNAPTPASKRAATRRRNKK